MAQDHRTCTSGVVVRSAGGPRHACTMGDNTTIIIFARRRAPQQVGTKTARAMFARGNQGVLDLPWGTQGPRERKACAGSAQGPPDASPSAQGGPLRAAFVQSTILKKMDRFGPQGPTAALNRRRRTAPTPQYRKLRVGHAHGPSYASPSAHGLASAQFVAQLLRLRMG